MSLVNKDKLPCMALPCVNATKSLCRNGLCRMSILQLSNVIRQATSNIVDAIAPQ